MKKLFITIPICVVLTASIIVSIFFMNIKPNTSNISTAQKIAEYTKPAVVRIYDFAVVKWRFYVLQYEDYAMQELINQLGNETVVGGSASGAIISSNGYIVTNAHVVETTTLDEDKIANLAFDSLCNEIATEIDVDYNTVRSYLLDHMEYESVAKYLKVILPGGDIKDGEIKSFGAPAGEGKDVAVIKIEEKNLPTIPLGSSENVQLQDNIWVLGYPAAADSELLSGDSILVVSITDGKISATDKKSAQGATVFQVDAASTHGNSGGPVINENGAIIGLLTFRGDTVGGQEVQGFNFVVPVDTVKEFVNQSGAKNEPSNVDKLYKEGLELYWGGYYKDALIKFEGVQRLYPGHSEIKRFITDCQQKTGSSKILWSNYKTIFIIYDSAAGVAIILLILFTFVIKTKKPQPDAVKTADVIQTASTNQQESTKVLSSEQSQNNDNSSDKH